MKFTCDFSEFDFQIHKPRIFLSNIIIKWNVTACNMVAFLFVQQ